MRTPREDVEPKPGPAPGLKGEEVRSQKSEVSTKRNETMTGLQYVAWMVAYTLVSSPGYMKATGKLKEAFEERIEKELTKCGRTRAQLFVGTEPAGEERTTEIGEERTTNGH